MRDSQGERWLTITQAISETGMSRTTIKGWLNDGVPSQLIRGRRWIPETQLFARLRLSLSDTHTKSRWRNQQAN